MGKNNISPLHHRRELLHHLYSELEFHLGPTNWWPADTPFEICVGAILTQNAPWQGVVQSIAALKAHALFSPEILALTPPEIVAEHIRPCIYYNQKAIRLKSFCSFLVHQYDGNIELMCEHDSDTARLLLLSQKGIGKETADSILCYVLAKPVFVVDAYTRRIFSRHGHVSSAIGYDALQNFFLEALCPDARRFAEFHALLCLVGAKYCKRTPDCGHCPVSSVLGERIL